jgi:uncharacterized membrane protein YgcG
VSVEHAINSSGAQADGEHTVSQPSAGRPSGRPRSADRARLAVVENEFASVTVSLDTAGHSPRLHVRDNETGDDILLSAIELASLCLATSDDRAGWLKVGLYRDQGDGGSGGSDGGAPGHGGAPGPSVAGE